MLHSFYCMQVKRQITLLQASLAFLQNDSSNYYSRIPTKTGSQIHALSSAYDWLILKERQSDWLIDYSKQLQFGNPSKSFKRPMRFQFHQIEDMNSQSRFFVCKGFDVSETHIRPVFTLMLSIQAVNGLY